MKRFIAIDLGTTNTVVSVMTSDGELNNISTIEVRQNKGIGKNTEDYSNILPSKIYVHSSGKEYYGKGVVKEAIIQDSKHIIQNMKLNMGLSPKENRIEFYGKYYDHVLVASKIIQYAIEHSNIGKITENDSVIITTPASFNNTQNEQTLEAARLAGIETKHLETMEEPVAALFNLIRANRNSGQPIKDTILVVDIGGGTTDIVLIDVDINAVGKGKCEIITKSRFEKLGGTNFDRLIAKGAIKKALNIKDDIDLDAYLEDDKDEIIEAHLGIAEEIKEYLIENYNNPYTPNDITRTFTFLTDQFKSFNFQVENVALNYQNIIDFTKEIWSYEEYKNMNQYSRNKNIFYHIHDALDNAYQGHNKIQFKDITRVYLVGGMSAFGIVGEEIINTIGSHAKITLGDKLNAVSKGACYFLASQELNYTNIEILNFNRLADSYFIEVSNGLPQMIAQKGEKLPVDKTVSGFRISEATNTILLSLLLGKTLHDSNLKFESTRIIKARNSVKNDDLSFDIHLTNHLLDMKVQLENRNIEKLDFNLDKSDEKSNINVFSLNNFPDQLFDEYDQALEELYALHDDGLLRTCIDQTRREFKEIPFVEICLYLSMKYFENKASFYDKLSKVLAIIITEEYIEDKDYFVNSIHHIIKYWNTWEEQRLMLVNIVKLLDVDKFYEAHKILTNTLINQKSDFIKDYLTYFIEQDNFFNIVSFVLGNPNIIHLFSDQTAFERYIKDNLKYKFFTEDLEEIKEILLEDYPQIESTDYFKNLDRILQKVYTKKSNHYEIMDIVSFIKKFTNTNNTKEKESLSYRVGKLHLNSLDDCDSIFNLYQNIDKINSANIKIKAKIMAKLTAAIFRNTSFQEMIKNHEYRNVLLDKHLTEIRMLSIYAHGSTSFRDLLVSYIQASYDKANEKDAIDIFIYICSDTRNDLERHEQDFIGTIFIDYSSQHFFITLKKAFVDRFINEPLGTLYGLSNLVRPHQYFFFDLINQINFKSPKLSVSQVEMENMLNVYYDILLLFLRCNNEDINNEIKEMLDDLDDIVKRMNSNGKFINKRDQILDEIKSTSKPAFIHR